jgi:O-antigen/teichoic acid export membrane protein
VILARSLGPHGKGVYALAVLFPSLIRTFTNLGLGSATVYYVAQRKYPWKEVFGNNIILNLGLSLVGCTIGFVSLFAFQGVVFPEVPREFLFLALLLVPLDLFRVQSGIRMLLGAERIKEFNIASVGQTIFWLVFLFIALKILKTGVIGALWANILSSLALCVLLFYWLKRIGGGISFRLNGSYMRESVRYGTQAYLSNLIGFLNYRIEVFLLSFFLSASAVGLYSMAVGIAEKLWLVSKSAATLIFPMVSAETEDQKRTSFTSFVGRTVFLVTAIGATILFVLAHRLIPFLYSEEYLPSVSLFRVLLPGIVFLSAARILANDIAGRGKPMLNTYAGGVVLLVQLSLNIIMVPEWGALGSAWASTIAYGIDLAARIYLYIKVSGDSLFDVVVPQRSDWNLYRRLGYLACQRVKRQSLLVWSQK